MLAYKGYFCEIYGHLLKNSLLFVCKFKCSEAYISLNIDLGPIKVLSLLDFADQTEQLWHTPPMSLNPQNDHFLLLPPLSNKQNILAYNANFCEIYGHLLKISLLLLYKFKFS